MVIKDALETNSYDAQECWQGVQRIAASHVFHRAARVRELLLYLADRSLYGSPGEITESQIADKVFGRKDYNPVEDNLVRATVRQLRLKLKEYFETEGKGEPWIAELPKGHYHISFSRRPVEQRASPEAPVQGSQAWRPSFSPSLPLFAAVVTFAFFSTAIALVLAARNPAAVVPKHKPTLMDLLLANPKQPTQVVVIDSALVLFQSFAPKDIGLEEYAGRTYLSSLRPALPENTLKLLDSRQITSFSDVEIASTISRDYGSFYPIRIRHSRSMNVRDFKSDNNFVLIGSPLANPWVALFSSALNFQFENHTDSWPVIRNRHPRKGEQSIYGNAGTYDEAGPQYARIAVLHSKSGSGHVALIAGTSMEGTEAAGEAFLNPNFATSLAKLFQVDRVTHMPDFEVVIETEGVGGAGYGARILAGRKVAAP